MQRGIRRLLAAGVLGLSLVASGARSPIDAQTPPSRVGTTGGGGLEGADNPLDDGRGSYLSWIGLLGLAGLIGLRGRKSRHNTTYVDATTAGPTGKPM